MYFDLIVCFSGTTELVAAYYEKNIEQCNEFVGNSGVFVVSWFRTGFTCPY